jgi:hypothetical protein
MAQTSDSGTVPHGPDGKLKGAFAVTQRARGLRLARKLKDAQIPVRSGWEVSPALVSSHGKFEFVASIKTSSLTGSACWSNWCMTRQTRVWLSHQSMMT